MLRLACLFSLLVLSTCMALAACTAQDVNTERPNPDPRMEWLHLTDPVIELKPSELFWPDELMISWIPALKHSESDLRREAADSIAQAYRRGMPKLEAMRELLLQVLETDNEHPVTRTAAARALVTIGAREYAETLAKHAALGPQNLTIAVETALAEWDYLPAREVWLKRLDSTAANSMLQRTAILSLAAVKEVKAIDPLSRIALSPVAQGSIRLAAADALSQLPADNRLSWSRQLMTGVSANAALDGLVGVQLLSQLTSTDVIEMLDAYSQRPEPTVAAAAMRQLLDKDPAKLVARAAATAVNPDANIRLITAQSLRTDPSITSVDLLASMLNDSVPAVRYEARRVLLTHCANAELRTRTIELTETLLQQEEWRALEQVILILTELKQLQIGPRLNALLDHERPEVYVCASWGLKTLADPSRVEAVYQAMLATSEFLSSGQLPGRKSEMLTHLIEAVGVLRHTVATEHFKTFVPKNAPFNQVPRTAAIWALGYLQEGNPDAEIVGMLESRLSDANSTPAESELVRGMSAVALARMKSESSIPPLRHWYQTEGPNTFIGRRSGWGVSLLTGEPLPEVKPLKNRSSGWFIQPTGH